MRSFVLAQFAAAAFAAAEFKGVSIDKLAYDTVHSEVTFKDKEYELTSNWGSVELITGQEKAHVLAVGFQVAGVDIPTGDDISVTASFEDNEEPGKIETFTCSVKYTKPAPLEEDKADEGGTTMTTEGTAVAYTIGNSYNAVANSDGTWFGDDKDSYVSYASSCIWPAKPAEDAAAPAEGESAEEVDPVKNCLQMCSAARVVASSFEAGIVTVPIVEGSNMALKLDTEYHVMNSFTVGTSPVMHGEPFKATVKSESGAVARFAAAATTLIAIFAF